MNNTEGSIKFNITLELDSIYNISHLTRKKGDYETINIDESFYHYFNHTINNTVFQISPTIFAYNDLAPSFDIL